MTTSTVIFPIGKLLSDVMAKVPETCANVLRMLIPGLWKGFLPFLPYFLGLSAIVLVIAIFEALNGKTRSLGRILYRVIFWVIFGVLILIFGLELLFEDYTKLIMTIVGIITYGIVGIILAKFKR